MDRIYVSGPMTGHKDYNFHAFDNAEDLLRKEGWDVVNPCDMTDIFGGPEAVDRSYKARRKLDTLVPGVDGVDPKLQEEARLFDALMEADLAAVRSCHAIYMLLGWELSNGAKKELKEAIEHGLTVILQVPEEDEDGRNNRHKAESGPSGMCVRAGVPDGAHGAER